MIMIRSSRSYLFVLFLVLSFYALPAAATVSYKISLDHPEQHVFHVTMHANVGQSDTALVVALPAWNALYQVRDFAYRVRNVRAIQPSFHGNRELVSKLDKQTWRISIIPGAGVAEQIIDYDIEIGRAHV